VRQDLVKLVEMISAVPGIDDISLSTNAVLLDRLAEPLRDAGLNRINVSLDSLRPDRVDALARRPGSYQRIMDGLAEAERVGFDPIKINTVLIRGRNDDEIRDFARLTQDRAWHVRFIEIMPTDSNLQLSAGSTLTCDEALELIREIDELVPVRGPDGNGPADYFQLPEAMGTIGVITPMSHNFCDRCNRFRLTADGQLRPCLFGDLQTNLRDPLRAGSDILPLIEETLRTKPERHLLVQGENSGSGGLIALSQTGG
jgi:cyclic pyranopterin phosphate synthase